jgi:hypothetical protein
MAMLFGVGRKPCRIGSIGVLDFAPPLAPSENKVRMQGSQALVGALNDSR